VRLPRLFGSGGVPAQTVEQLLLVSNDAEQTAHAPEQESEVRRLKDQGALNVPERFRFLPDPPFQFPQVLLEGVDCRPGGWDLKPHSLRCYWP
jgi:hypothetical protein